MRQVIAGGARSESAFHRHGCDGQLRCQQAVTLRRALSAAFSASACTSSEAPPRYYRLQGLRERQYLCVPDSHTRYGQAYRRLGAIVTG